MNQKRFEEEVKKICNSFSQRFKYNDQLSPRGITYEELLQSTSFIESFPLTFSLASGIGANKSLSSLFESFAIYSQKKKDSPIFRHCLFPLFCRIITEYRRNNKGDECDEFVKNCLFLVPEEHKTELDKFLNDENYFRELSSLFVSHRYIISTTEDDAFLLNQYLHQPFNSQLLNLIAETVVLVPIREEVPDRPIYPKFNLTTPISSMNILHSRISSACFIASSTTSPSIFSTFRDNSVVQIHTDTQEVSTLYHHSSEVTTMSLSSTCSVLLTSDVLGSVKLWSPSSFASISEIHSPTWCSSFAPQGGVFSIGSNDGIVRLYDTPKHKLQRVLVGHKEPVVSVDFHPNCSLLASASRDTTTRIWDLREAETVRLFICENRVNNYALAMSGNGKYVAVWDGKLYVNDIGSGKTLFAVPTHANYVVNMAFSFDSRYVYMMTLNGRLLCCDVKSESHEIAEVLDVGEKIIACEFLKSNEIRIFTSSDF